MANTALPSHVLEESPRLTLTACLQAAALTAALLLLYGRVTLDLVDDWWSLPAYSHGLLLLPIVLLLVWWDRHNLFALPKSPENRGLWVTGGACMLYVLGQIGAEFFLLRISLIVLAAGLVLTFWGKQRLHRLAFPGLLLSSTIPLPVIVYNALAAPLQLFASGLATTIAQELGISAYRDGNVILLANIALGVAEACSGLSSMSALMVASLLLGFLTFTQPLPRILLFLLAFPTSIAVNVLRVTGTAVMADFNEKYALGFYHAFSGWLVFLVGFGCLYAITGLLKALASRARS